MLTSIADTAGMSFINDALSNGPCGPVQAYVMLTNVGFVIFEAIRLLQIPTTLQLVGFVMGILGGLVLSLPD